MLTIVFLSENNIQYLSSFNVLSMQLLFYSSKHSFNMKVILFIGKDVADRVTFANLKHDFCMQ